MHASHIKETMLREYKDGKTVREVCAEHHVSKSSFYEWLRKGQPLVSYEKTNLTHRMYYDLEQEGARLKEEVEILHKVCCSTKAPLAEKLSEMARLRDENGYSVHALCRALDV